MTSGQKLFKSTFLPQIKQLLHLSWLQIGTTSVSHLSMEATSFHIQLLSFIHLQSPQLSNLSLTRKIIIRVALDIPSCFMMTLWGTSAFQSLTVALLAQKSKGLLTAGKNVK
jgi:hypothetical protein